MTDRSNEYNIVILVLDCNNIKLTTKITKITSFFFVFLVQ